MQADFGAVARPAAINAALHAEDHVVYYSRLSFALTCVTAGLS
jgi:hypothetical protein